MRRLRRGSCRRGWAPHLGLVGQVWAYLAVIACLAEGRVLGLAFRSRLCHGSVPDGNWFRSVLLSVDFAGYRCSWHLLSQLGCWFRSVFCLWVSQGIGAGSLFLLLGFSVGVSQESAAFLQVLVEVGGSLLGPQVS